jgi:cellulose synthase/poly-beta-1,6-N-acetylglucosamine synthase-like glycosyltransferase
MRLSVVVPVKNRAVLLDQCLRSLLHAQSLHGNAEIVVVDNGSTDGSPQVATRYAPNVQLVYSTATVVGGVRNAGAIAPDADAFVFVDCDCEVRESFLSEVELAFEDSGAAAVGCEVISPSDGHWTEVVSDQLHRPGGDGFRSYINSACFAVRADPFRQVGGFDEFMTSSEDVDICRKLLAHGHSLYQSESLAVVHYGNPQSLVGFFSRLSWHGEGVLQQGRFQPSFTAAASIAHALFISAGLAIAVWAMPSAPLWQRVSIPMASLGFIPAAFVAARAIQYRRSVPVCSGIALMSISLLARLNGLLRSVWRHMVR